MHALCDMYSNAVLGALYRIRILRVYCHMYCHMSMRITYHNLIPRTEAYMKPPEGSTLLASPGPLPLELSPVHHGPTFS